MICINGFADIVVMILNSCAYATVPHLETIVMNGINFVGSLPEGICPSNGYEISRSCNIMCACCDYACVPSQRLLK